MAKKSKTNPEAYHHGDLRRALLDAAIKILKREGAHALSLREAARVAGVSHAAPYRHFQDKEALLAAIAQEGFQSLNSRFSAVVREESDLIRRLRATVRSYLRFALEHPDHFRLMFGGFIQNSENFDEMNAEARRSFGFLVDAIDQCQKLHQVKTGDPVKYAAAVWSTVHGYSMLLIDGTLDHLGELTKHPEKSLDQFVEYLMDGIKVQSSKASARSK